MPTLAGILRAVVPVDRRQGGRVATLAFGESELLAAAKLGILTASVIAGCLGFFLLRRITAPQNETANN